MGETGTKFWTSFATYSTITLWPSIAITRPNNLGTSFLWRASHEPNNSHCALVTYWRIIEVWKRYAIKQIHVMRYKPSHKRTGARAVNWMVIGIGVLMLVGCFLSINSWTSNSFYYDSAFLLLIAGIITIAFGIGVLDIQMVKDFIANNGTTNATETIKTE